MYKNLETITECYSCGLFVKKQADLKIIQRCPRCNSKLDIDKKHSNDSLYYAISSLLLFGILNIYPIITLNINENELKEVEKIKNERFGLWEWNYGKNFSFQKIKKAKFKGGTIELTFEVKNGLINNVKVYGDFFGVKTNSDLEELLINKPYNKDYIGKLFREEKVDNYFYLITSNEIIDLLFE